MFRYFMTLTIIMSKSYTFVLILIALPIIFFGQDIDDEAIDNLNQLIYASNNSYASEFCQIAGEEKINEAEELPETIQAIVNKFIESRSYASNDLSKKEVLFKLKYDAFKICKDYKNLLISKQKVNPEIYQFMFLLENGRDVTPFLEDQEDCGKIASIQNSIKLISEDVFMDLSDLQSEDDSYKIRYFKFHPKGRAEGEILKSAENLVAEMDISFKDSSKGKRIDEISLNSNSKLFKISQKNYKQKGMVIPGPAPEQKPGK